MALNITVEDILSSNYQLDQEELYGDKGRTIICELIKSGNKQKLEEFINKYSVALLHYTKDDFDILVYSIKNSVPLEMLEFIIEKAPYKIFDYTIKEENSDLVCTPLFAAIAQNSFSIADALIKRGANINMTLNCAIGTVKEEEVYLTQNSSYKYYDVNVNRDCFTHEYSRVIYSNIIQYLCEANAINSQNIEYLKGHGFNKKSVRPGIVKQLERNNKLDFAKLISKLISEDDDLD